MFVNQEREIDAGLFAKLGSVDAVAEADCSEGGSFAAEGRIVLAQLRDVLTAEDSPVVPQENDHGGLFIPQRAQPDFAAVGIRKTKEGQLAAESGVHG